LKQIITPDSNKIVYADLSYAIVGAFFDVHTALGAGFVESIYEKALVEEFSERKLKIETQKIINLYYKKKKIGIHKLDMVVEDKVVLELKAVDRFCIHHKAQLRSYLKAGGYKLGILVNFSKSKVEYERILIR